MKVYVVTAGSYSDFRIDSIYLTRELAQQYIDLCSQESFNDLNDIEEWEVNNKPDERIIKECFYSSIDFITGEITVPLQPTKVLVNKEDIFPCWEYSYNVEYILTGQSFDRRIQRQSFVSQEHANKRVVEQRQFLLQLIDPNLCQELEDWTGKIGNAIKYHPKS